MSDNTPPQPESFGTAQNEPMDSDEFTYEKTKVDEDSAKERLGRDIYTDETQAFEEMHSNGVTAIHEASDRGFIDFEEGVFEIELMRDEDDNVCMRVRDNGIGMNEDIVRDVFLNFGITTGAQNENVVAQFGMGVASYPNLVGFHDGKLYMETNPRYDDEALYGYYSIDGLEYKVDTNGLRILSEEEYGTAYEMWLRDDISVTDVKSWVERVSDYNDVPIELTYENGDSERIEPSTVYDKFDTDNSLYVEYEDEEIGKFVAGMNVPDDNVLIHRAIKFSLDTNNGKPPFKSNVFIRLYTESEKVCEGEHKGMLVMDDSKYAALDEEMKDRHIPRSEVSDDVAVTPRVVGNREKLSAESRFSEWIVENLSNAYYNRVETLLDAIHSDDDFYNLGRKDGNFVQLALSNNVFGYSYKYQNFSRRMDDKYQPSHVEHVMDKNTSEDYDVDEDTATILSALFDTDAIMEVDGIGSASNIGWKIEKVRRSSDTTVYMGVSINDKKKRVARDDDHNSIIVRVDNAGVYDRYETVFGWNKLKEIKKSTLDQYDISEDTKNLFTNKTKSVSGSSASPAETLTVHYGRRKHSKKKMTASFIKESLENDNPDELYGTPVVAFPDSASRYLSDYYAFAGRSSGLFNCSNSTWESLEQFDEVKHIEGILQEHKSITEISTEGEETEVQMALEHNDYYVIISPEKELEEYRNIFGEQELCNRFKEILSNKKLGRSRFLDDNMWKKEVMVISENKLQDNHFIFDGLSTSNVFTIDGATIAGSFSSPTRLTRSDTIEIVAHLMLVDWVDEDVYEEVTSTITYYNDPRAMLANVRTALENGEMKGAPDVEELDYQI